MAADHNDSKTNEKKEKNYRSRYDVNRPCYREDETHYVYEEWVQTSENMGCYRKTALTVGEGDVTLELLDYLQGTDNSEVQDQEDDIRNKEKLAENIPTAAPSYEDELCADEAEEVSPLLKAFNEKVLPHLTEDQINLIYDRYGRNLSLEEIAAELPPGKDGKPVSHQAVTNRLNRIFAKVKKYMAEE